ncbi:MAG: 30S ribosomal protein S18 [candidate division WWE3 bacterium]|nr:30S ribosomal protein S18 [candidate division WWE3 bacterium]
MLRAFKRQKIADECGFCKDNVAPSFKDVVRLKRYLTERHLIVPRKYSSVCASHQRQYAAAVKNARFLALIPYTDVHAL